MSDGRAASWLTQRTLASKLGIIFSKSIQRFTNHFFKACISLATSENSRDLLPAAE